MRCSTCRAPDLWQIAWSDEPKPYARSLKGAIGTPRAGAWIGRGAPGFPEDLAAVGSGPYCFGCAAFRPDEMPRLGPLLAEQPTGHALTAPVVKPQQPAAALHPFRLDHTIALLERAAEKRVRPPHVVQTPRPARTMPTNALKRLRREVGALLTRDLYTHQHRAIDLGLRGQNVVIATATASGKSRCYQTLTAQCLAESGDATVLYLAPLNALIVDQLDAFDRFFRGGEEPASSANGQLETYLRTVSLGEKEIPIARYDGAVPSEAHGVRVRAAIREAQPRLLLTNPEMLVQALLPNASRSKGPDVPSKGSSDAWAGFFRGLRLIIVDELHAFRGVFGAHLANVLRRVRRMADLTQGHSERIRYFASSATIRDPAATAQRILGVPMAVVDETMNGAPRHRRVLVPISSDGEAVEAFAARLLPAIAFDGGARTIVFRDHIASLFRIKKRMAHGGHAAQIDVYAATRPSDERLDRLRALRAGGVNCLLTTSALELGIDVGDLNASVLLSYPGSIAKTWQMFGRAGRAGDGLLAFVAGSGYLDQYWLEHIDELVGDRAEPEEIIVNPDNPFVVEQHVRGAALDHVLDPVRDRAYFEAKVFDEALENLKADPDAGIRETDDEVWVLRRGAEKAAHTISLRSLGQYKVPAYVDARDGRLLREEPSDRAPRHLFRGSVFLWDDSYYESRELHVPIGKAGKHKSQAGEDSAYAIVTRVSTPKYVTVASVREETRELTTLDGGEDQYARWGGVEVRANVDGYYKRFDEVEELEGTDAKDRSAKKTAYVPFQVGTAPPENVYRTQGMWFDLPSDVTEAVPDGVLPGALRTVGEAIIRAAPLLRFVSPGDLSASIAWPEKLKHDQAGVFVGPHATPIRLHINETVLGGAGLAKRLHEERVELLKRAKALLRECPRCSARRARSNGCPRCVAFPNDGQNRMAALLVFDAWEAWRTKRPPLTGTTRGTRGPVQPMGAGPSTAQVLRELGVRASELGNPVGSGGMGEVWRGERDGEDVAIKIVRSGKATPTALQALRNEASILESISHPHIVRLRRVHPFKGSLALELDWAGDGDLGEWVLNERSKAERLDVLRKIVSATAHLHRKGVVHRDLKDANILFRSGEPLVADFGISRAPKHETAGFGTLGWAAPEQLTARTVAKTMDVWALGKLIEFLFTRSVDAVNADDSTFPPEIPRDLQPVLARCVAGAPKARFQDASELLAALPKTRSMRRG